MKNAREIAMKRRNTPPPKQQAAPAKRTYDSLKLAASRARAACAPAKTYDYPIQPPRLAPGVVPAGANAPVMAMDARSPYEYLTGSYPGGGFPGFAYLSQLATRAEYRAFASSLSTELTREWIEFTSQQEDEDQQAAEKIKLIEAEFKRLDIRGAFQKAAEHDCYFGRAQFFVDIKGADAKTPLILDPRTVPKGSLARVSPVEAMWTTPSAYNSLDPSAPDFYKPTSWFMLGREVHASRLLTVVTRPLPDMLKPAFNFAGMSLSQLAEPYVDNWLRTRQSVSDLINNFSITALATDMGQVLTDDNNDGSGLFARADFFTATRSNKGLMLLDREREELVQINTPLSGLHELQAQSQEHMCATSRIPAMILTGISPSGLNASSDGEIRVFYDWIAAQQEAFWRAPLETMLQCVQLSLFGEIDSDIGFKFVPLYQMTPKEAAEIRESDCRTATAYINAGVLDPSEERERIARDPDSGYHGLDLSVEIVDPNVGIDPMEGEEEQPGSKKKPFAQDADFDESKHPRADNGQFGKGGGGKLSKREKTAVSSYSGDDFLRVNSELRNGDESDPVIKDIDSAIDKSSLESGSVLYRGLTKDAAKSLFPGGKITAGEIVSDKAFLSTSDNEEMVRNSFGLGGVMLKIEVSGTPKGLSLSGESRNKLESETLLPRNAKMKVLGVTPPKTVFDPVVIRVSYGDTDEESQGDKTNPNPFAKDGWITVKPNGPDAKGMPVEIGEGGEIKRGMGGKFNGQKINEIRKDFAGPKSHEANGRPEPESSAKKDYRETDNVATIGSSTTNQGKTMKKQAPKSSSQQFNDWYENADMPEQDENGNWYDLETGLPFKPSEESAPANPVERRMENRREKALRNIQRFDEEKQKAFRAAPLSDVKNQAARLAAGQATSAERMKDVEGNEDYMELAGEVSRLASEIDKAIAAAGNAGPRTNAAKAIKDMYIQFQEANQAASREQNRLKNRK